ncbi:MAG: hypothetical protein ACYCO3_13535 [Mycobacteriales bacterium]
MAGAAAAALAATATIASGATTAWAYGTDHLYQVTISVNCQNQTICNPEPFGVGGGWGWIELDSSKDSYTLTGMYSADGELNFQGHNNSTALRGTTANNSRLSDSWFYGWTEITCYGNSQSSLCDLRPKENIPADPNGNYFEILAPFYGGSPLPILVPATPGHYDAHTAPGISTEVTVTQMN